METIKIPLYPPNVSNELTAQTFTKRKVKELDRIYNRVIPKWYITLVKHFPRVFSPGIRVAEHYVSNRHEIVKIYFFGMEREEIHFYYY